MGKDPAALMYIDTWLTSTAEMDADVRGWYLNLILHNYDKNDLPNDIEKLAVLAGVKFSEFKRFEQVFEQVFKHKFEETPEGRLTNAKAFEILQKRKSFVEKRSRSGKMSYVIRYAVKEFKAKKKEIDYIKENIELDNLDTKNEQVLKQVLKHLFELYRNGDKDGDSNTITHAIEYPFESEKFIKEWDRWKEYKKLEHRFTYKTLDSEQSAIKKLAKDSGNDEQIALQMINDSIANGYKGLFRGSNNKGHGSRRDRHVANSQKTS